MARLRLLSNDTADPWGLMPHSVTHFHYLCETQYVTLTNGTVVKGFKVKD